MAIRLRQGERMRYLQIAKRKVAKIIGDKTVLPESFPGEYAPGPSSGSDERARRVAAFHDTTLVPPDIE
jgi:hypothetical protein